MKSNTEIENLANDSLYSKEHLNEQDRKIFSQGVVYGYGAAQSEKTTKTSRDLALKWWDELQLKGHNMEFYHKLFKKYNIKGHIFAEDIEHIWFKETQESKSTLKELCDNNNDLKNEVIELVGKAWYKTPDDKAYWKSFDNWISQNI